MANMQGLVDQRVIDGIVAGYLVRQNVRNIACFVSAEPQKIYFIKASLLSKFFCDTFG